MTEIPDNWKTIGEACAEVIRKAENTLRGKTVDRRAAPPRSYPAKSTLEGENLEIHS